MKYGIWITLFSITGWMRFFNVGLGQGLRNKLAIAIAKDEITLARTYVSTTYAILTIIIGAFFLVFILIQPFISWSTILNAPIEMEAELGLLGIGVITIFCLQFILKLITTILLADQFPAAQGFFDLMSQILSLVAILIIINTVPDSIVSVGFAFTCAPLIVLSLASIILFSKKYQAYRPSWSYVDFTYTKSLMSLGFQFFIISIASIVLFATDNMIITQVLGPAEVTPYHISQKYFGIGLMVFGIIVAPFWTAFTDAYTKNDLDWIKKVVNKLLRIWLLMVLGVMMMLIVCNQFYRIWIGDAVTIPFSLSLVMAFFVVLQAFNIIFVNFINGVGKLRLQIYTGIFAIVFNIPLSILFAKYLHMGSTGVILATLVSTVLSIILRVIQYHKIMDNTATGIWNK